MITYNYRIFKPIRVAEKIWAVQIREGAELHTYEYDTLDKAEIAYRDFIIMNEKYSLQGAD